MPQTPRINQSLSYRIWRLNNKWQRDLRNQLAQIGLTYTEFVIMSVLVMDLRSREGIRRYAIEQKKIWPWLNLDKKVVSQSIEALHKKGLVRHLEDMFDTRTYIVSPSPKGRLVFDEAYKVVNEFDKMQGKHGGN